MKANMAESEVECFSWVKATQNSKTEGGFERKKHKNVKLKEENVPGAILPGEKLAECTVCYRISEFNFKLAFRSKRTYSRWIRLAFGIL